MGIVKIKNPSTAMIEMGAPKELNNSRSSIGMEHSVKEYFYINLDALIPFKNQARSNFKQEEIEQLALSIVEYGVRQPLTIVMSPEHVGKFEIISGERRARAARLAGLEKVPCIIMDNYKDAESVAIIENIHRSDLHPVELARAFGSLINNGKFASVVELGNSFGIKKSTAYETLQILTLPQEVQQILLDNYIVSREKIRTLLKSENPKEAIKKMVHTEPSKIEQSRSVMRIGFKNGVFSIQKEAVKKLSDEDRGKLKKMLLDIIKKL